MAPQGGSRNYSKAAYQASEKSLRQRSQQPQPRPRGNYRVDEHGNPILPDFQNMAAQDKGAPVDLSARPPHSQTSGQRRQVQPQQRPNRSTKSSDDRFSRSSRPNSNQTKDLRRQPIQQGRLIPKTARNSHISQPEQGPSQRQPGNYRMDVRQVSSSEGDSRKPSGKWWSLERLKGLRTKTEKVAESQPSQSGPVHRKEYDQRMATWQRRMQQPRPEETQVIQGHASKEIRKNYKLDPKAARRQSMRASNFRPSPHKGRNQWYYDLQDKTFHRWKEQKAQAHLYEHLPNQRLKLLAVFVGIATIFTICFKDLLPINRVNEIRVAGNNMVSSEEIIQASKLHHLDRIDRVYAQEKDIKKMMKKSLPMLDTITFERQNWQSLKMNVTEFDMIALMENEGILTPVLSSGDLLIFDGENVDGQDLKDYLPLLVDFDQKSKISDLANNALRNLDSQVLNNIDKITYNQDPTKQNAIVVSMKDGNEVHAIINTFAHKMSYYPQMVNQLEGRKGIINLEVGAYFTPQ